MTKTKTVLIVEDDTRIATILADYLKKDGFETVLLHRGDRAVEMVRQLSPQIVLLDIMLPGQTGIDVCREIRRFSPVPIIFVTARVEEIDRLIGLEIGADDYICKPFSPREVVARVKAVLRRTEGRVDPLPGEDDTLTAGPFTIEGRTRTATVDGIPVVLTPIEYELLKTLMSSPGKVFARTELVTRVLGYEFDGYERTVDSHIKNLRKKLNAAHPGFNHHIETVYGIGYRLGPVQ